MDCLNGGDSAARALPPSETPAAEVPVWIDAGASGAEPDAEYWRREVAVRLQRYRARRKPRASRYPSLCLPFDSAESAWRSTSADGTASAGLSPPASASPVVPAAPMFSGQNVALQLDNVPPLAAPVSEPESQASLLRASLRRPSLIEEYEQEQSAKIIEFPRSAAIPVFQKDELAEPVWDRPRIIEAPEVVPAPPAMGGILIEAVSEKETPKRRPEDVPLHSASVGLRMLAGLVDSTLLVAALAAFGAIFWRINPERGPVPVLAAGLAIVAVLLWAAYQFLFVVYTGSTPGLRVVRLRLAKFDGSSSPRRVRRWRVLASFLSAFSLGLGFLWSLLDEDGLCWHDRITHTHVQRLSAARPDSSH